MTEQIVKPSVGRIVHFVNGGVHYAAVVTKVYGGGYQPQSVDLTIFPPPYDAVYQGPVALASCISFDERALHGTWHWPERVESFQPFDPPSTATSRP